MAKKKTEPVETTVEAKEKAVRLMLTPEYHRLLRIVAADAGTSMAEFAQQAFMRLLDEEAQARSIKR